MTDTVEKDALAEAWDAGHRAGVMWDHTQHTDEAYSPDVNPYRVSPSTSGDDQ